MKITLLFILLLIPFCSLAEVCEISGEAIWWAYDACYWENETDDSLHPGVIECVNEGEKLIATSGACAAKRIFKARICTYAQEWGVEGIDPKTCMTQDKPLGPAVREGGI